MKASKGAAARAQPKIDIEEYMRNEISISHGVVGASILVL